MSGGGGSAVAKNGKAGAALKRSPVHLLHRALQLGLELYADEVGAKGVTQRQFAVLSAVAAEASRTRDADTAPTRRREVCFMG